jgi:4-oxalocrotonate tautomerase
MSMAAKAPVIEIPGAGKPLSPRPTRKAIMPIVTIQITQEGSAPGRNAATETQKAALIKGASQLLLDVLHKPLDATFVVIEEVPMENFGWGGLPVAEFRKRRKLEKK